MRRRVVYQRSKLTESFEGSRTVLKRVRTASATASNSLYTAYMQRIRRLHTAFMPLAYRLHASCIPLTCRLLATCNAHLTPRVLYTMYGKFTCTKIVYNCTHNRMWCTTRNPYTPLQLRQTEHVGPSLTVGKWNDI